MEESRLPTQEAAARGEICLAWRDQAGSITGYEVVGKNGTRHQFPPPGRERGLYRVGNPATASQLVITATAAEALSRRQAVGDNSDIAYIATGGPPQPDQVRRIAGFAAARPELGIELVVAQGADAAKTIGPLLKGLQAVRDDLHHPNRDAVEAKDQPQQSGPSFGRDVGIGL